MFSRGTVVTALATPFRDAAVDAAAFVAAVDRQALAGIDAIAVGTAFGEGTLLSFDERAALFETAVVAAAGRLRVFAHVGSNDTMRTIRLAAAAQRAGADAIIVVTPYYNRPGFHGFVRHLEMVAARINMPILVEIDPGRTGVDLTAAEMAEIGRMNAVAGFVDGSGDVGRAALVARRSARPLAYLAGDEPSAAMVDLYGADGVVSAVANLAPAAVRELAGACACGNGVLVRALDRQLRPLMQVLKSGGAPALKFALHVRFGISPSVRLPLVPLGEHDQAHVVAALDQLAAPPATARAEPAEALQ